MIIYEMTFTLDFQNFIPRSRTIRCNFYIFPSGIYRIFDLKCIKLWPALLSFASAAKFELYAFIRKHVLTLLFQSNLNFSHNYLILMLEIQNFSFNENLCEF